MTKLSNLTVGYEKNILWIFMNSMTTVEMNEILWKNHGGMLTQLLLSHLLFALSIYQIKWYSLVIYSMVRYTNYLIYIFINIHGNIRNERPLDKSTIS